MRDIGNIIGIAGAVVFFLAYIWAFVLASRVSGLWFVAMFFLGWILYPFFAYKSWPLAKNNCVAIVLGLVLLAISFVILWATNPNKPFV